VSAGTTPRKAPFASVSRAPSSSTVDDPVFCTTTNSPPGSASNGFAATSTMSTSAKAHDGTARSRTAARRKQRMPL
jgi:hypothetical protein